MLSLDNAWKLVSTYELEPLEIPNGGNPLHFVVQVFARGVRKERFQARVFRKDHYDLRPAHGALDSIGIEFATVALVVPDESNDWEDKDHESEEAAVASALQTLNEQLGLGGRGPA